MNTIDSLNKIKTEFDLEFDAMDKKNLDIKYLGKKSALADILNNISSFNVDERKDIGKLGNEIKKYIAEKINSKSSYNTVQINSDIDVTLPGKRKVLGKLHPHTIVQREMNGIFKQLGFSVYAGPELETDEYVFERLNLPKNHPARSLQDTLIIEDPDIILRSHTSSVEARAMDNEELPLRIVVPGRAFRYEDLNQTNHFAFYQYQGVAIGEDITLADLKGAFESFAKSFFGATKIRIRAKYYPEVEPGVGLDILCTFCNGDGCSVCKRRGWIEAAGGGMVHPYALRASNIDSQKYSGFAFGMGFDRIVMQKLGITDIRKLYDGTLN